MAWSRPSGAAAGGRPERRVTFDHADDGSLLVRGRFPAEEGAVVMAALLASTRRPDACAPLGRDRLDLELAVDAMLAIAPLSTEEPPGI